MQKFLLAIISGFLPLLALANLPPLTQDPVANTSMPAFMNSAPPAQQQYHSVDEPAPVKAVPVLVSKKAKAIAPTKESQAQQKQLATQLQGLESRLTQFTQTYLLAQQESKQQLSLLEQKTIALQAEIEQSLTVLKTLNQQIDQLKIQTNHHQQLLADLTKDDSSLKGLMTTSKAYLENTNNMLLLAALLLLLSMWWLMIRMKKRRAQAIPAQNAHEEDDTKNEYDFMGSSEGVPAQLDLARAYIAMENYVGAENVLHQVLEKGDTTQQQQARELLEKIAK